MSKSLDETLTSQEAKPFVNENLMRAENRINVALFGAHAIPGFWKRLRTLLGLPEDAYLDRVVANDTPHRPDFVVMQAGKRVKWVEVELGGRNKDQLAAYKEKFKPVGVISVVGRKTNPDGDSSLEEIGELAREAIEEVGPLNLPAKAVLEALVDLIDRYTLPSTLRPAIAPIPPSIQQRFRRVLEPLNDLMEEGLLENRPTNPNSLSLRLMRGPSVLCSESFALLTMRDPAWFLVPAPAEVMRIFSDPLREVVDRWRDLVERVHPGWRANIARNNRITIRADEVETHAPEFAAVYTLLRDLLSRKRFTNASCPERIITPRRA